MGSAVIGNLAVNLSLETAAFLKGLSISEKRLGAFGSKLGNFGKTAARVGAGLSVALTAPLVAFGTASFKAASDAAELDSAFAQTFGKLSAGMDKWAEATGNAMGRSTGEIKDAANTFGIFFNTAMPQDKAAAMSRTFATLAEDLGSFYNVDTATAIEKLRAGLAGEAEPLRAFGVFLNEAAVKAKAAQMGIVGVNGALTDQQKIAVRAALILEQTQKAQGDVARTSDSTANRVREFQAALRELQVSVGTKLLPMFTPVLSGFTSVFNALASLPAPVQGAIAGFAAFAAAVGPLVTIGGGLTTVFGKMLPLLAKLGPALGIVRTALLALMANPYVLAGAAVITGIYLAWQNWDKIAAIVQRVYIGVKTWLGDKLKPVFDWVKSKVDAVTGAFRTMWDKVVGHSYVPDMVDGIATEFGRLKAVMVDVAQKATEDVGRSFADVAVRAVDGFAAAFTDAITGARSFASAFSDLARSIIADIIQMTTRFLIFKAISGIFGGGAGLVNNAGGLPTGWSGANPTAGPIGMASGGSGIFGGFGGIDRNVLSLNGTPIARVSKGEHFRVDPDSGGPRNVTINQRFQFDGVAITEQEFVRGLGVTKAATIAAIRDMNRRR